MVHLGLTLVTDLAGAAILFPLSLYSLKAFRLTGMRVFAYLFTGFSLLASGVACRGLALLLAFALSGPRAAASAMVAVATTISLVSETLALALIALGYHRQSRAAGASVAALLKGVYSVRLVAELLDIFLLMYILIHSASAYEESRSRLSLMVLAGFALLLASHVVGLAYVLTLSALAALLSKASYIAGLLSFLAVVVEVSRAG